MSAGLEHLVRRLVGSLSRRPPSVADVAWAHSMLSDPERALWSRFAAFDQRHTIEVARRFEDAYPAAEREEMAAALLHDIGKLRSGLGTFGRVVATMVGPRTTRFRTYHDHERIGAAMLAEAGSSSVTVALVDGTSDRTSVLAALRSADDI